MPILVKIGIGIIWFFTLTIFLLCFRLFHAARLLFLATMFVLFVFQIYANFSLQRRKTWAYAWAIFWPCMFVLKFAFGIVTGNVAYSAHQPLVISVILLGLFLAPQSIAWFRPFRRAPTDFTPSEPK